jgi:hypothetical protein
LTARFAVSAYIDIRRLITLYFLNIMAENKRKKGSTKKTTTKKVKSILRKEDTLFFEELINTPSPTGFEWTGQKVWLDYITPYVDETFVDTYGTAVATINP